MNIKPTVSIVMITYNSAMYVKEQLDSILSQTYPIFELIIQDDCSTDSTKSILLDYSSKNPFIKVFFNDTNMGVNNNFKSAVKKASGDYIALSDHDDIWFPEKIEKQVNAIGDKVMCFSDHITGPTMNESVLVSYKNHPEHQLFRPIVGHSMLLKKSFAQDDSSWLNFTSYDFSLGIMAHLKGGVAKVNEPLNWHRYLSNSVSHRNTQTKKESSLNKIFPYIFGVYYFEKFRKSNNVIRYFSTIREISKDGTLVNLLSSSMINTGITNLLKLQYLCMINRKTIYPGNCKGITGIIRGWFFPFIYAKHFSKSLIF